jgi:rhodanese-related sulfurtransferase
MVSKFYFKFQRVPLRYETNIGRIEPPKGGAEFLDPMMRNSREFPKWLNAPETKEKLKGKKVMMYCTGGIRCERATALLSQMERATDELETQGIYHVRGGIDRYLKTFPEGGYWKGRNYLFDLRGGAVYTLNPVVTHSVKAPGFSTPELETARFQPLSSKSAAWFSTVEPYRVMKTWFQAFAFKWVNLYRYSAASSRRRTRRCTRWGPCTGRVHLTLSLKPPGFNP